MESWLSWTIMLSLCGLAYWYYSQNDARRRNRRSRPLQRVAGPTASAKDELNKAWGDAETSLKGTAKAVKPKAVKKENKKPAKEVVDKAEASNSTASSIAGGDADDDMSPALSPALDAVNAKGPSGKDVSDMLEPQGAAPSVLRLTPANEPTRKKQPQPQRPATPQETKKQRQNKKRAEEAKLQREHEEKARQVLLEKQRRTAREARGEPARNGLPAAKAPASNPWSALNTAGSNGTSRTPQDHQLLDTFDADAHSTASSSENPKDDTSATTDSMQSSMHWANMPSEEEQFRMAMEDSEWTTVPKGGKKNRKQKTNGLDASSTEGEEVSTPQPVAPAQKVAPSPEKVEPKAPVAASVTAPDSVNHPMDSDWPVV